MGNKKEKSMTAEGARKLLEVITKYETTKEGDPKRTHFSDIIWTALHVNAVQREPNGSLDKYAISNGAVSKAFKSISGDVAPEVRNAFIKVLKAKINAVLNPVTAPAASASLSEAAPATM